MRGSTAGLADGVISPPGSVHAIFLEFLDNLFSSVVLAPIIVIYWRGTWDLMDVIIYTTNDLNSALISLGIGIFLHLIFTIFQNKLAKSFHPDKHRITFLICSRMYTYIYGIGCVNGWRSGWLLMTIYFPHNVWFLSLITIISAVVLAVLKGLRNICATPFAVSTDHSKDYFFVPTMYKISGSKEPGKYILDCLFSVLVIGTLVVFVWRGLWVLCDLIIYPDDKVATAWASLMIGYGIVGVTFALQSLMKWACDRLKGVWRVAAADIFLFFSFVGTVHVWRGVWALLDVYFLPNDKLLGDILTHGISFLLLALLNCSNSVLVRGVYIDAEEPAGQCVIFPVYYIRLFFQKERTKKQKRLMNALEKVDQKNTLILADKFSNYESATRINSNLKKSSELTAMLNYDENCELNPVQNGDLSTLSTIA